MINESKVKEWVGIFLKHIKEIGAENHVLKQEGYKFKSVETFQEFFNIESTNLSDTLEKSICNNNLTQGSMYFPRKMLVIFAQQYPEDTKEILKNLFNEDKDIAQRITQAEDSFQRLIRRRNKEIQESSNSFIGLRFLSLILSFYNPNKYNALKPREWNVFCKFIDEDFKIPNGTRSGDRYVIYSKYIDDIKDYIKQLPEINELRSQLTRGLKFTDEEFRWMAQDVIYVTARILAREKSDEVDANQSLYEDSLTDNNELSEEEDITANLEFPLETYLENTLVRNWDNMNFGEPLTLYRDEDGVIGQQYITDVGIIDLLAKDKDGNFVIIELKRGRSDQKVIGQILSYMGWVRENLVVNGEGVRGIVIASDGNKALLSAQREVSDRVKILYYRVKIDFEQPKN